MTNGDVANEKDRTESIAGSRGFFCVTRCSSSGVAFVATTTAWLFVVLEEATV